MDLSARQYYRALKAQDPRFDGCFYICVSSTGIYCRPICPARTTKFENCRFVRTAAEAEEAGYRACLRCRPETAPGSAARMGATATVRRALRLISESAGERSSMEQLSARLGVGGRHLRRLFKDQLGATPKSIVQTERFAIARQLLIETDPPVSQVAFASGFGSIRGFNDATRKAFGVTPGKFRHQRRRSPAGRSGVRLLLGFRPPYAWPEMLAHLRARAVPGLERVTADAYLRAIVINRVPGVLSVRHDGAKNRLATEFHMDRPVVLTDAIQRVREMFDLDASPGDISEHLGADPLLAPLVDAHPGLRIPGAWDVFELTVRAVVGQQISVRGATTMLGRLVDAYGGHLVNKEDARPQRVFPAPSDLAGRDLREIGVTGARARTLAAVAEAFAADPGFIHPAMEIGETRRRLLDIRGIGPWTADYVALRALRNPDAFPAADLVLLKASGFASPAALTEYAETWRPWRGYAAQLLWTSMSGK